MDWSPHLSRQPSVIPLFSNSFLCSRNPKLILTRGPEIKHVFSVATQGRSQCPSGFATALGTCSLFCSTLGFPPFCSAGRCISLVCQYVFLQVIMPGCPIEKALSKRIAVILRGAHNLKNASTQNMETVCATVNLPNSGSLFPLALVPGVVNVFSYWKCMRSSLTDHVLTRLHDYAVAAATGLPNQRLRRSRRGKWKSLTVFEDLRRDSSVLPPLSNS